MQRMTMQPRKYATLHKRHVPNGNSYPSCYLTAPLSSTLFSQIIYELNSSKWSEIVIISLK